MRKYQEPNTKEKSMFKKLLHTILVSSLLLSVSNSALAVTRAEMEQHTQIISKILTRGLKKSVTADFVTLNLSIKKGTCDEYTAATGYSSFVMLHYKYPEIMRVRFLANVADELKRKGFIKCFNEKLPKYKNIDLIHERLGLNKK